MSEEENNLQETAPEPPAEPEIPQFPTDRIENSEIDIPSFPSDRFEKGEIMDILRKIQTDLSE